MKVKYKYRWIYVGLFTASLVLVGFIFSIYPALMLSAHLRDEEKNLAHHLAQIKQQYNENLSLTNNSLRKSSFNVSKNKWDVLDYVLTLIHLNGLTVQSIKWIVKPGTDPHAKLMRITIRGRFQQFSAFIFTLNQASSLFVQDFNCKLDNTDELFRLDIAIPQPYPQDLTLSAEMNKSYFKDPLCSQAATQLYQEDEKKLITSISLYSLRMVGFLQKNSYKQALLLLPTNDVIAVHEGMLIGQEKAKITDILENQISFLLPNNKSWIVRI